MIMDDMQAYFERRRFQRFKTVLDEMRKQDVVGSLRQFGDDLSNETGMSIAQCEYWSDTLDRWADDLVDPACGGKCPGCKAKGSLPPSIVLEVLQILEARSTCARRRASPSRPAGDRSRRIRPSRPASCARRRTDLTSGSAKLTQQIRELPDGEAEFANEIGLLGRGRR